MTAGAELPREPGPDGPRAPGVRLPGPPQAWRPRPYQQLLRGPTFRWWRPLLSVAVATGGTALVLVVVAGTGAVLQLVDRPGDGAAQRGADPWLAEPGGFLLTNLSLAALIPVVSVATWAGFGWRPRWVSSVAPGLRWTWLLRCYGAAILVLAVLSGGLQLVVGYRWTPERNWGLLVLITVFTTPLQAAGEEYVFRGWIPQLIGSAIPDARLGAVVGGGLSSTLFAFAHGQQDVWLFADRFLFGALACWLVWRTGGLEAGMALHGANNIVALLATIGAGELSDTLGATSATPGTTVFDALTLLATVALIVRLARQQHLVRLFTPPAWALP
ncbi:MAG TPA: CPBP family intramembrane glutamic endopeptidase [Kineosporiaceae bacterium]